MTHRMASRSDAGVLTVRERDELWAQIRAMLLAGSYNDHEIARKLGCADRTVFRYRSRNQIPSINGTIPKKL